MVESVTASYYLKSTLDIEDSIEILRHHQSGTIWYKSEEKLIKEHEVKVKEIKKEDKFTAEVKIEFPISNFKPTIPNILSSIAGHFYGPFTTIKLLDIEFPKSLLNHFGGPRFGIEGLRKLLEIKERPFFISVIKPSIGQPLDDYLKLIKEALTGGIDIVKDDDLIINGNKNEVLKRIELIQKLVEKVENKTGQKKMFFVNITSNYEELIELAKEVPENIGIMVNFLPTGFSSIETIRRLHKGPIMCHPNMLGSIVLSKDMGFSPRAITKIQRISGSDFVIATGFNTIFTVNENDTLESVKACYEEIDVKKSLPCPAARLYAGNFLANYEKIRSKDFGIIVGGGVFGHPLGAEAGAKSIVQAWESIEKGIAVKEYAKTHKELKISLESLGKVKYIK